MSHAESRAVGVDFDGVIHRYSRGWADGSIYDPPVTGALEALRALMARYPVFVFTSRNTGQVAQWLAGHGFGVSTDLAFDGAFWRTRGVLLVTNRKLGAMAYIDDRAIRFAGWDHALAELALAAGRAGAALHVPRPGDAVEAWLLAHRDMQQGDGWLAVDCLLSDYRAHAAAAMPLTLRTGAMACDDGLVHAILEAACQRDGLRLDSDLEDGPARNYELALRLGIGHVFCLGPAPGEEARELSQ